MPTLSSPTTNVTVREGEDIILTCIPSVDTVTLKWQHIIPGLGPISTNLECVDEYCHTIIISDATFINEGQYVCHVISDNIEDEGFVEFVVEPVIIDLTVLEGTKSLISQLF